MKNLSKNEKIGVVVGIMVVGFFFVFGQYFVAFFTTGTLTPSSTTQPALNQNAAAANASDSTQLISQDITPGTGDVAQSGSTVTVNYTGTFTDGTVFDSSVSRGVPYTFVLGAGNVIKGWDQGIVGMKVGGKRILVVPPSLAYGNADYGPIPGGSTLVFQIELVDVKK